MFLPRELTIYSDCYAKQVCDMLHYFLPQCNLVCVEHDGIEDEAVIKIKRIKAFAGCTEKYRITINQKEKVLIEYDEYPGLRNALAKLSQLVQYDGCRFSITEGSLEEEPVLEHRGVMLDLARGIRDFNVLCHDVIFIAKCRMNRLHLHLFDDKGLCFKMDSVPASCCIENAYTKEQMKELCKLASLLSLEVIPEFDMPAHATRLLQLMPDIQCEVAEEGNNTLWTVCAGSEKTYQFYEKVIHELAEVFPGKYIHIGGDELEFSDIPEPLLCHWESCKKCRSLSKREHISGKREIFYYFVNRIYEIVKKEGRRMIMWSDQIDCEGPVNIPKDVIMHFWRVAAKGRGPTEGCSMQRQLELGYDMINSYYRETYLEVEHHMSSETIRDWRWNKRPECDKNYASQIIGSEICFWEYGNKEYAYYDRVLYPAVAIMADKLWTGKELEYTSQYSQTLTRLVLGAGVPDKFDVYACLGDVIPPRNGEHAYYEKVMCGDDMLREAAHILQSDLYQEGECMRAKTYLDSIHNVLKKRR